MHIPPHPGRVLKNTVYREESGISVTDFANMLKIGRVALSRVLNCERESGLSSRFVWRLRSDHLRKCGWECRRPTVCGRRGKSAPRK